MSTPAIREAVGAAASGASAIVSLGAGTLPGDLLVVFFDNDWGTAAGMPAPTFSRTVNSLTLQATGDGGTNAGHTKIYTAAVTASGSQTVTFAPNIGEEVYGHVVVIDGSTISLADFLDGTPQGGFSNTATVSQVAPSVTVAATPDALLLCNVGATGGGATVSYTPPAGMTEQTDVHDGAFAGASTASLVLSATGATGTQTFTCSASTAYSSGSIVIKGGDSSSIPNDGYVPDGIMSSPIFAPMGMLGLLSLTTTYGATENLPSPEQLADADFPITATLATDGASDQSAVGVLAVTATFGAVAGTALSASAALAVAATLAAAATHTVPVDAAISAAATLSAGQVAARLADAALAVTATSATGGTAARPVDAALSITAAVAASTAGTTTADAALAATAVLLAAASRVALSTAALSVTATLTATDLLVAVGAAPLAVTATLAATATDSRVGSAALAVTATVAATTDRMAPATASLPVTATVAATGTAARPVDAALPVTATLVSSTATVAAGVLSVAATLVATASLTAVAGGALAVTVTITGAGARAAQSGAALAVTISLTFSGTRTAFAAGALSVTLTGSAGFAAFSTVGAALAIVASLVASMGITVAAVPFVVVDSSTAVSTLDIGRTGGAAAYGMIEGGAPTVSGTPG